MATAHGRGMRDEERVAEALDALGPRRPMAFENPGVRAPANP